MRSDSDMRRPWRWWWPLAVGLFLGPMIFGPWLTTPAGTEVGRVRGAGLGGLIGLGVALTLRFLASRQRLKVPDPQADPASPLRPDTRITGDRSTLF
jgi:hypothetical protein